MESLLFLGTELNAGDKYKYEQEMVPAIEELMWEGQIDIIAVKQGVFMEVGAKHRGYREGANMHCL